MSSPTARDRFLAALLRPFAGNDEQRQAARALAEGWMDEANRSDDELGRAAKRFEAMKTRTGRWRRIAALALGCVALVALLLPAVRSNPAAKWEYKGSITLRYWFYFHAFQCTDYALQYGDLFEEDALKNTPSYQSALTRGLDENQSMMLSCDPDFGTDSKQARNLWKEHFPDDPACHYHYLRIYREEFGHLPEGAMETAKRLDPDNGYVPLLAAMDAWETGLNFHDDDDEQLSRGLRLFHEAAGKPILTGRSLEWHRKCAAGFRPTGDASTCTARFRWSAYNQPDSFGYRTHKAMQRVVPPVLFELAWRKDREALDRLAQDIQTMAPKFSRIRGAPQAMTRQSRTLGSWASSLGAAYANHGMEDQAIEIRAPHIFHGSNNPIISVEKLRILLRGASMSGVMTLQYLIYEKPSGATSLEPEDLTPGRLADYCDFEWLAIRAVGLILLLLAGAAALFWRFMSPSSWKLGKHLARSLDAADRAWILGLGLAAPILWYALATRAPVFRTREIGIWGDGFWIPLVQSIAALALILCFLVQTIRWRLARRLRVVGFGRRSNAWGWLAVAIAAIALPLTGLPAFVGPEWDPDFASWPVFDGWPPFILALLPSVALLGVSFLWLFLLCASGFAGRPGRNPSRAATGFLFACGCLPATLFLAFVASPMVKAEFRHWLERDPVLFVDPACDGMTKYEYKLMKLNEEYVRDFWERQNPAPPRTRTKASSPREPDPPEP